MITITSDSVCVPVVHVREDGQMLIGRMPYTKMRGGRPSTTIRHIMETGKNGYTISETLVEGLRLEGAKHQGRFDFRQLTDRPIHIELVPDQDHPGGWHLKTVWPVFVPEDQLRDYEKPDDDDPDEAHGPIDMLFIRQLIELTDRKTVPFHFRATLAVVRWAAGENLNVFERYEDLLIRADRELYPFRLTPEQEQAIAFYPRSW